MTLEPDPNEAGLWLASPALGSGVHALVIGVSDYPYLKDGSAPAPERAPRNGNMGQLEVSAKTAAAVFDWLRQQMSVGGAPLASCRLCLAPRAGAETSAVQALVGGHYADARFVTLRHAIEQWGDAIAAGGASGDPNVAFFFYSGHGLEHLSSPALLAEDILNPATPRGPRNAIAFNSLWQAVRTYGIDRAFFFVDACRNSSELAKTLHLVGEDIIDPDPNPVRAPEAVVWLQATGMGEFAYQVATDPATIFGQGLLEALDGPPPSFRPYDVSTQPWTLLFSNLERHVKRRVGELIQLQSSTIAQPVEPGGYPYLGEALVAQKSPDAQVEAPGPAPAAAPPSPEIAELVTSGAIDEITGSDVAARSAAVARSFRHSSIEMPRELGLTSQAITDFGVMHDILGHESVTEPWIDGLEILDARSGEPLSDDVVRVVGGSSHEASERLTAWVDLMVAPQEGQTVWIEWRAPERDRSAVVLLPRDSNRPLPVRLDLTFRSPTDADEWRWSLDSMKARIAEPRGATREVWEPLFKVQQIELFSDIASAAHAAEQLRILEHTLEEKIVSPVAAAVAASLLLRAGALDRLHDWPRNLADWIEWLPDGPVLWAETLLRRADRMDEEARARARDEAREYFAMCATRGVPLLGAVLEMAARQLRVWQRRLAESDLPGTEAEALTLACSRVEHAATYAVSGSVFAAFASESVVLTPDELLHGEAIGQLMMG